MNGQKERMSLREHFAISKRAVRLLYTLNPRYIVCMFVTTILTAVSGYIPVYFSAKLVDALISHERVETLILYAALAVLPVFLISMICAWCGAVESTESYLSYIRQDWMYSEKAMELPYKALEDPEIERQNFCLSSDWLSASPFRFCLRNVSSRSIGKCAPRNPMST